jgi:hypothetical protein
MGPAPLVFTPGKWQCSAVFLAGHCHICSSATARRKAACSEDARWQSTVLLPGAGCPEQHADLHGDPGAGTFEGPHQWHECQILVKCGYGALKSTLSL